MDDESLKKLKVPECIKKLFNYNEVIRVVSGKVDGRLDIGVSKPKPSGIEFLLAISELYRHVKREEVYLSNIYHFDRIGGWRIERVLTCATFPAIKTSELN